MTALTEVPKAITRHNNRYLLAGSTLRTLTTGGELGASVSLGDGTSPRAFDHEGRLLIGERLTGFGDSNPFVTLRRFLPDGTADASLGGTAGTRIDMPDLNMVGFQGLQAVSDGTIAWAASAIPNFVPYLGESGASGSLDVTFASVGYRQAAEGDEEISRWRLADWIIREDSRRVATMEYAGLDGADRRYELRWFSPSGDLEGHTSLPHEPFHTSLPERGAQLVEEPVPGRVWVLFQGGAIRRYWL